MIPSAFALFGNLGVLEIALILVVAVLLFAKLAGRATRRRVD